MGIKDKLPLISSERWIIRLLGYIMYTFVALFIIGILVPSPTPEAPTPTKPHRNSHLKQDCQYSE